MFSIKSAKKDSWNTVDSHVLKVQKRKVSNSIVWTEKLVGQVTKENWKE